MASKISGSLSRKMLMGGPAKVVKQVKVSSTTGLGRSVCVVLPVPTPPVKESLGRSAGDDVGCGLHAGRPPAGFGQGHTACGVVLRPGFEAETARAGRVG